MKRRNLLGLSIAAALGASGISPRSKAQGETAPMVKLVFLLHRRPGMALDDFSRYWREEHGLIGAAMPGVRRYVQNHATQTLDGSPLPCDGFAEMWFDDMESLQNALVSPAGQAAMADSEKFLDVARIQTFVVEEATIV